MKRKPKPCSHPGCTEPGLFRVENDNWLCHLHITDRINSPGNRAATQANEDLRDFLDDGGKPS
jgi:hypothetical protein